MTPVCRQAAVIPYRVRDDQLEIALVTSASGKRWIVPKGKIDEGERPREAAIREAEEEAGLRGVLDRRPLGRYDYSNENGRFRVDVYMMRVTVVLDHWLEEGYRRRRWVALSKAAAYLRPDLHSFVQAVPRLVASRS